MVDDRPEDTEPSPDSGRAKRAPPTIDLEATEVSGDPHGMPRRRGAPAARGPLRAGLRVGGDFPLGHCAGFRRRRRRAGDWRGLDSGMARGSAGHARGSPGQYGCHRRSRRARRQHRVQDRQACGFRARSGGWPRRGAGEIAGRVARRTRGLRAQSEKLAAAVNDVKSAPRAHLRRRISPRSTSASPRSSAPPARRGSEAAPENAKPADDVPLRRVVAAALLDVSVRQGDPYAAALAAAKSLAANPDALKPLDGFAASGVPNAASSAANC